MRKWTALLLILLLVTAVPLSGCGKDKRSTATYAETLYAARNPYINNNAADADIADSLRLSRYGKYTLSVDSKKHPYTLTISYMYTRDDFDAATFDQDMPHRAAVLLALIKDCEQVDWSYPNGSSKVNGSLSIDAANQMTVTDVKATWKSQEDFTALLDHLGLNQ